MQSRFGSTANGSSVSIVWFRNDLRLADQPALTAAIEQGGSVLPVFIFDQADIPELPRRRSDPAPVVPDSNGHWPLGGAARWWLAKSLQSLDSQLRAIGSRLIYRLGTPIDEMSQLIGELIASGHRVTGVFWTRRYEPSAIATDTALKAKLRSAGLHCESFNGQLLHEPWTIKTQTGTPYKVFTPFSRACLSLSEPVPPLAAPRRLPAPHVWPESIDLESAKLRPALNWDAGFSQLWQPGRQGAERELSRFLASAIGAYSVERDFPDRDGTSRLSPHLHWGEISPREIWHDCRKLVEGTRVGDAGLQKPAPDPAPYLRQLLWREFAHHLLFHFPYTDVQPLRPEFAEFPWMPSPQSQRAWEQGETGYPIVDAGMRQLWATGWMHNRVRMIVGSLLVKHLLQPWQSGARWFWDTLVDADLANNTLGWQWIGGCGADAAPYFRIFNPVTQSERFDPDGTYISRFCPELAKLPAKFIHAPWEAPTHELREAGVVLGKTYPAPIVDLQEGRDRALAALAVMNERKPVSNGGETTPANIKASRPSNRDLFKEVRGDGTFRENGTEH